MEPKAGVLGMHQMHPTHNEPQKSEAKIGSHYCKALQCVQKNPVPLESSRTTENTCNIES